MANIKSAIKRIRTAKRNRLKNLRYLASIKKAVKAALKSKEAKDVRTAIKCIDKAAAKRVIHRNAAARKKSKLMKLISV